MPSAEHWWISKSHRMPNVPALAPQVKLPSHELLMADFPLKGTMIESCSSEGIFLRFFSEGLQPVAQFPSFSLSFLFFHVWTIVVHEINRSSQLLKTVSLHVVSHRRITSSSLPVAAHAVRFHETHPQKGSDEGLSLFLCCSHQCACLLNAMNVCLSGDIIKHFISDKMTEVVV